MKRPLLPDFFLLEALMVILCGFLGCGKMGPPFPPERLNPEPVKFVSAVSDESGVLLSWLAPRNDELGRPLKVLNLYRVYRRLAALTSTDTDRIELGDDFKLIGEVKDVTMQRFADAQALALSQGKPLRRVTLSDEDRLVVYKDSSVKLGGVYIYYIVPVNQTRFEGRYLEFIKVIFTGNNSSIEVVTRKQAMEPLEDVFAGTASLAGTVSNDPTGQGFVGQ
jgi:hypothetical protein